MCQMGPLLARYVKKTYFHKSPPNSKAKVAWLRAAATRAGFMGPAANMLSPAIPAMGPPPPPWPETAGAELRLLTPLTVSHRVSLPHRSLGSPWTWWTQGTCSDIY